MAPRSTASTTSTSKRAKCFSGSQSCREGGSSSAWFTSADRKHFPMAAAYAQTPNGKVVMFGASSEESIPDRLLEQFDFRPVAVRRGEACIAGDECRAEGLGKHDVGCVVGREIVTILPDAGQQGNVRMTSKRKRLQKRHSLVGTELNNCAIPHQPPKRMDNFQIDQMRRVKFLTARGDSPFDAMSSRGLQQPVDCGRGVENDQRSSRPSRTMRAVSIGTVTGSSLCRRSRNSAKVGCSAI